MGPHPFERLFAPRGIAVFGAEGDDSVGARFLRNIAAAGFPGSLHAVGGGDVGPSVRLAGPLAEIEGPLDLAILAVAAPELRTLVRGCGERGVAGAVIPVLAALEAGQGGVGPALARDLRDEAARHGLRLLGPNSVGLLRPAARLDATFSSGTALPGSLALVSQSGALCTTVLDWAAAHRIGFSAVTSLGDAVDVDFGDVLRTLIESSRIAGALSAGGGLVAGEVAALKRMLWALSELVCELPELRELELHPLVAVRSELVALGARATAAAPEPGARRYGHLAIHPYPSDVGARWQLADGTPVTVRPIRPEDARMEASFVRDLSPMTRYFRFMVPIRELGDEALVRFTQLDYDRELALLAVVERDGEESEIAVARYVMLPDGRSAELAIVVADGWQRKGLGARLLGMLVDVARARGIPRLEGEVLAENAASRAMLRRLGFTLRRHPEGPQTFLFEKDLGPL